MTDKHRHRMVARRRHLPDLPAVLGGRRRGRDGRPARHHRPAAAPRRARRRRRLALAVLHLAAARRGVRRGRLPRRRPAVRLARRRRRDDRARPRARPARDGRHRAEPLLERAPVVPGGARVRAGECRARALHLPRRHGRERRRAAEQLGQRLRRPRVDPGHRGRRQPGPVVPPPLRRDPARLRLDQPGGRRRDGVGAALLAGPRRRRLPHRRRPRPGQGRGAPRRRPSRCTRPSAPTTCRCGTSRACTTSTAAGARSPTPTPSRARTPTASCAPRRGCCRSTSWPSTSAGTSCTSRSTSAS